MVLVKFAIFVFNIAISASCSATVVFNAASSLSRLVMAFSSGAVTSAVSLEASEATILLLIEEVGDDLSHSVDVFVFVFVFVFVAFFVAVAVAVAIVANVDVGGD